MIGFPDREALRMWRCFVCGSERVCAHREEQLVLWCLQQRKPPARETSGAAELATAKGATA
jgi:hypothetical protein